MARTSSARNLTIRAVRCAVAVLLVLYLFWNAWWLAHGHLAPSLAFGLAGIPGPSTGIERALFAMARGDWALSFQYCAFAIPYCSLTALTVGWLGIQSLRRRAVGLPKGFYWTWLVLVLSAWAVKLCGNPEFW